MAEYFEVKAGLDSIAATIREEKKAVKLAVATARARLAQAIGTLDAIPATHKDVRDTIAAYPANSTDTAERQAKAELAKLTPEFTTLRAAVNSASNALNAITEF
jgi:hypothetical protein